MPPIKVALVGLSQSAKTSWASHAHLPYLLSARGRERYNITALLNSSIEAAHRAIDFYELPPTTKAYGTPEALAADKEVELVVCVTRVDLHYDTVKPSIEAGKDIFVEWPLAENMLRAAELTDLARAKGVRTIVGLQARLSPAILKIRSLLSTNEIGNVLSSDIVACTPGTTRDSISEGLSYFFDRKVGGNPITIAFGHMIDFVHYVLGDWETGRMNAHTQIQRPRQQVVDRGTGRVVKEVLSDVPDLVSLHGSLALPHFDPTLTVNFRTGPPFPGTAPFSWTITGTDGEIRITSERGPFLQSEANEFSIPISIHNFASGEVREVKWEWETWQEGLMGRGRNLAMVYDLFASAQKVPGFEEALRLHGELDGILGG